MASEIVHISYRDEEYQFELLDECSVSEHLRQHKEFYELDFLEGVGSALDPATMVLDVGAHIGNHTVYFAGVLGHHVLAFEPNPESFELLQRNVAVNRLEDRVTCIPEALSSQVADLLMVRAVDDDAGTMAVAEQASPETAIRVRAGRLDDVELEDSPPVYVKVDVEGHEPEVLRGGLQFIKIHRPHISVEIQSLEALDEIVDLLGADYLPTDVFNATPTVLLRPRSAPIPDQHRHHLVRYAIRNALDYGHRRNWYLAERGRADRLRGEIGSLRGQIAKLQVRDRILEALVPWLEEVQAGEWIDPTDLVAQADTSVDRPQARLLVVKLDGAPFPASVISVMSKAVDLVDCDARSGRTTRFRRFVEGRSVMDRVENFGLGALGAARVSLLVEDADDELGPVEAAALIGGESSPSLEEAFLNFLPCPYIVVSADPTYRFSRLTALTGAARVFLTRSDRLEDWSRSQIIPAEVMEPSLTSITQELVSVSQEESKIGGKGESGSDADTRILIVSYYAPPATPVSVQRLAYWHRTLPAIAAEGDISAEVIWLTATYRAHEHPRVSVVPDRGAYVTSGEWFERYTRARDLGLDTMGISWAYHVEQSINSLGGPFSTVVLSGNPFHYFALGPVFKAKWGSKVILDFRDPYAHNPRFNFTLEQREFAQHLEADWVAHADAVVSVNRFCLDTVAPGVDIPRHVVANGYDETVVERSAPRDRQTHHPARIAYSGTVFPNLPLDGVLDSLPQDRFELHHFGRDYSASRIVARHPAAVVRGLVSYSDLIPELRECVAGIIMTTGEPSTQTTKVFDYLACDLDIIIVTSGRPRTGNLHDVTSGLDGIFWVENTQRDLRRFFAEYEPTHAIRPLRDRFSRREQTRKLFDLIRELEAS